MVRFIISFVGFWLAGLFILRQMLHMVQAPVFCAHRADNSKQVNFPRLYRVYYIISFAPPILIAFWALFALPEIFLMLQKKRCGQDSLALFSPYSALFIAPCGAFLGPVIGLLLMKLICFRFWPTFDCYRVLRYRESYARAKKEVGRSTSATPDKIESEMVLQISRQEWPSILRPLILLWLLCGPLCIVGFDSYIRVASEGVMINGILSLGTEERVRWEEIKDARLELLSRNDKNEVILEPLFVIHRAEGSAPLVLWHSFGFGRPESSDIIETIRALRRHAVPAVVVPITNQQQPSFEHLSSEVRKMVLETWSQV